MAESATPTSPINRIFKSVARVEPRETTAVIAAFFLFFFVLGSYFAVRPVRETIATSLGNAAVADLWLYTAAFSIAIVPIYGWLVGQVRRSILLPSIYAAVAVILVVTGAMMNGKNVDHSVGAFFYVWISVLNLLLVSIFWSFLLEMFSSEQTKRLFGLIAGGGTAGALVGPLVTRLVAGSLGESGVLYIGAVGFVGAIICQRILITIWQPEGSTTATPPKDKTKGVGGNPFAGVFILLRSRYLMGIALFVVMVSAANTILYFEQLRLVAERFPDRAERTEVFATVEVVVQTLTIFTQFFLTGRLASKLGVRPLLTILPVAIGIGFSILIAFNVFSVLIVVFIARRWGEYALVRPGREMLFSGFDTETKYKAKNFIDVPVYRAADYVGAQAKTALDGAAAEFSAPDPAVIVASEVAAASPAASLAAGVVLAGLWTWLGWWMGGKHNEKTV